MEEIMTGTRTHILRAQLRPGVRRDIEIDSGDSLSGLAAAIVKAFDFDMDHAFGFYSKLTGNYYDSPVQYELFADLEGDSEAGSVERTTVAEAFPAVGHKMLFLYDYGDMWKFQVRVMRVGEKQIGVTYPRVVAEAGEAPPQYPDLDDEGDED
jgi:hypothetical protein